MFITCGIPVDGCPPMGCAYCCFEISLCADASTARAACWTLRRANEDRRSTNGRPPGIRGEAQDDKWGGPLGVTLGGRERTHKHRDALLTNRVARLLMRAAARHLALPLNSASAQSKHAPRPS